ncbi:MAG: hypothetical protein LBM68_04490 [Bacteroidales bacterium]|nr:hypothetical protein [Bacteroidales bacterium]
MPCVWWVTFSTDRRIPNGMLCAWCYISTDRDITNGMPYAWRHISTDRGILNEIRKNRNVSVVRSHFP